MQIMLFTRKRRNLLLSYLCYFGISNGFFSVFFVVSNHAYNKNTGFVYIKILSHGRPDHL